MSMTNNSSVYVYTPNSLTSLERPPNLFNANSPVIPDFTNVDVNYITPKSSSSGKIITINGMGFLKSDGSYNVVGIGFLSIPDDGTSFYSSIFSPPMSMPNGTQEIIFDMNQLVGVNGFTFSRYFGTQFGVVVQDVNQYISYVNSETIYTIDSE